MSGCWVALFGPVVAWPFFRGHFEAGVVAFLLYAVFGALVVLGAAGDNDRVRERQVVPLVVHPSGRITYEGLVVREAGPVECVRLAWVRRNEDPDTFEVRVIEPDGRETSLPGPIFGEFSTVAPAAALGHWLANELNTRFDVPDEK